MLDIRMDNDIKNRFGSVCPENQNVETMDAIEEVKRMKANPKLGKSYTNVDDMMADLLS